MPYTNTIIRNNNRERRGGARNGARERQAFGAASFLAVLLLYRILVGTDVFVDSLVVGVYQNIGNFYKINRSFGRRSRPPSLPNNSPKDTHIWIPHTLFGLISSSGYAKPTSLQPATNCVWFIVFKGNVCKILYQILAISIVQSAKIIVPNTNCKCKGVVECQRAQL